jgi:threonine synthase
VRVACGQCGDLLDVVYDWDRLAAPSSLAWFEQKWARRHSPYCFSVVWRFHELLPFAPIDQCVTIGEGQTLLPLPKGSHGIRGSAPAAFTCSMRG